MTLGQRVHQLRKQRGYSQDELADMVGIQRSYIGHIERGSREPSRDIIVALARALETTPEDLLSAAGYIAKSGEERPRAAGHSAAAGG